MRQCHQTAPLGHRHPHTPHKHAYFSKAYRMTLKGDGDYMFDEVLGVVEGETVTCMPQGVIPGTTSTRWNNIRPRPRNLPQSRNTAF